MLHSRLSSAKTPVIQSRLQSLNIDDSIGRLDQQTGLNDPVDDECLSVTHLLFLVVVDDEGRVYVLDISSSLYRNGCRHGREEVHWAFMTMSSPQHIEKVAEFRGEDLKTCGGFQEVTPGLDTCFHTRHKHLVDEGYPLEVSTQQVPPHWSTYGEDHHYGSILIVQSQIGLFEFIEFEGLFVVGPLPPAPVPVLLKQV